MQMERPILLVEDDDVLRQAIAESFAADGNFTTVGAATLEDANRQLDSTDPPFSAIILDVGLPDGNGYDFCTRLRQLDHRMPIIMLTGWNSEDDIVRGLDAGANDYISKPFRSNELLARVRTQCRMFENSEHAIFYLGQYTFSPAAKLLLEPARNKRIRLTDKETRVLKYLYRASPVAVPNRILLEEVWGYNSMVKTHTLETHIYRIRQKIELNPEAPSLLTSHGGSYRLNP
jgi:DNA-binding response OmpR family regulator